MGSEMCIRDRLVLKPENDTYSEIKEVWPKIVVYCLLYRIVIRYLLFFDVVRYASESGKREAQETFLRHHLLPTLLRKY